MPAEGARGDLHRSEKLHELPPESNASPKPAHRWSFSASIYSTPYPGLQYFSPFSEAAEDSVTTIFVTAKRVAIGARTPCSKL